MVKPENCEHFHLVYHFTIPLKVSQNSNICNSLFFFNKVAGLLLILWIFKSTFFAEHFQTTASKRCSWRKIMNNRDC